MQKMHILSPSSYPPVSLIKVNVKTMQIDRLNNIYEK